MVAQSDLRTVTPTAEPVAPPPSRFTGLAGRDVVSALSLAAMLALAGVAFTRIYSGDTLLLLLVIAAAGSVLTSFALRLLRVTVLSAICVSLVVLIGYLFAAVATTAQPGTGSVGSLFFEAIRNSGAQILTSTIPILPTPQTVVLPVVVVWLAGLVGAELTLRTRAVLAGFIAPTLAYVTALVLVGPNAETSLSLAAAFAGVGALGLACSGDATISHVLRQLGGQNRKAFRVRRFSIGAIALAALVVCTLLVGPSIAGLSDKDPVDPRTRIPPPQQELPESNPLGRLSGWARSPGQQLFTVSTNSPSRIRWVTLTDYNGLAWLPGSEYRSAGSVLPRMEGASKTTSVRQRYTMLGLDGLWLPSVVQPHEVRGARISYDPTTASLVHPDGLRTGQRYEVVSDRPDFDVNQLANAKLSTSAEIRKYTTVPRGLPDGIFSLATSITASAVTPYNQALLLEQFLLKNFTFTPEASSGHGLVNLQFFLTVPQQQGGQRGTSEQFAASFALLGRIVGLPTRISVGFHGGIPQGDNRFLVNSGDAFAWPEVYFAGHGWVPFDPTPRPDTSTPVPPEQATPEAQQQNKAKQNQLRELENPEPKPSPDGVDGGATPQAGGDTVRNVSGGLGIVVGVILLLVVIAVVVARIMLRHRRLRKGDNVARVLGAWLVVCDALRLAGRAPPSHFTASEIADAAAGATPDHPEPLPSLRELANAVNAVSFAPGLIADADVETLTRQVRDYVKQLRKRLPWHRRLLWWFRPGPLLWARSAKRQAASKVTPPSVEPSPQGAPEAERAQDLLWSPPPR